MTIPRNKRRTIVVHGITYEYAVTSFVSVFIKNLSTREEYSWYQEWKEKWGQSLKPSDIEELIVKKELNGIKWRKA